MAQDVDATHSNKNKGGGRRGGCWKHYPNDIKFSFFTFYILAGIDEEHLYDFVLQI